jgi:hypothetical protein
MTLGGIMFHVSFMKIGLHIHVILRLFTSTVWEAAVGVTNRNDLW